MCRSTNSTLFIEAPAVNMTKLSNRFAAGNRPRRNGWLVHVKTPLQLWQVVTILSIVPICWMLTFGLLEKQIWQCWNRSSSLVRNTIPLGSSLMFLFVYSKLKEKMKYIYIAIRGKTKDFYQQIVDEG